jgi:ankyrin repeat protein
VGKVRTTLKNLPGTLDDTYDRILSSIPDENFEIARSALMLLTYSIRPLTLQELAEAMVVDFEAQKFNPDDHRLTNYRLVLEICSTLVSVSFIKPYGSSGVRWADEKAKIERKNISSFSTEIEFAHFSVKEYMILERARVNADVSRFCFPSNTAHRSISEICLVYLIEFSKGVRLMQIDFDSFPFLAYAARFWIDHWRNQLALEDQDSINSLIRRILDSEMDQNSYINYLNICNPDSRMLMMDSATMIMFPPLFPFRTVKSLDSFPQPLYYTAQLGHHELCEWLIRERKSDVNSTRGTFGQPVQIAARLGHERVVQLLINCGADLNTSWGRYGYPLQAAAYGGHADVVCILLDNGADVDAEGGEFGSALIAACHEGHLQAARVLLDRGADMDKVCVHKGKAFNVAAASGNIALVRLLLQKGAVIDDPCNGEGTALYAASLNGALDIVNVLVAAGADVNIRSGDKCTALQVACSHGHDQLTEKNDHRAKDYLEVAKFLLKSGAEVNIRGGHYGNALQAAIEATARGNVIGNNIDIVNLLLDHGADVNYKGGIYGSSMRATVFCGNISAAHALLDHGVEIDDEIFLLAVENRRETVIPLLLEKRANVNTENKDGTVLQMAINVRDHETISALLKDPKIDINARGGEGGLTALYCAVSQGNYEVVKLLLNRGADINEPCDNGRYCLPEAVLHKDSKMVELLLQQGAHVNASQSGHQTALMVACDGGNEALVRLLLRKGADVNLWVPGQGKHPLH